MIGGPWYNTYICKKLYGKLFEGFIINARTGRYDIICSIYAYERYINHLSFMVAAAVEIVQYHKIQQQQH